MSEQGRQSRVAIAGEAAEWFVRRSEVESSRQLREAFTDWITESPVHVEEYLAIAKVYGGLAHVDVGVDQMVEDNVVVPLCEESLRASELMESNVPVDVPVLPRRWHAFAVAASVLLAVIVSGVFVYLPNMDSIEYHTGLGEQRSVLLNDGSMVSLNTLTGIEVLFDESTRRVRLLEGEALFEVEKDPARPFIVETASVLVRVTGTKFNVYEKHEGTAVTVVEGKVMVVPNDGEAAHAVTASVNNLPGDIGSGGAVANLVVGDQAVVRSGSVEIQTHSVANLEPVTAWTERRLVFDATPLSSIVTEFNRYNHDRLMIEDKDVAELALSGVFSSNDPESLILFLERIDGVDIVTRPDGSRAIVGTE